MAAARHAHRPPSGGHWDAAAPAYPCSPPQDPSGYPCSPPHVAPFMRPDQRDTAGRGCSPISGPLSAAPAFPPFTAVGPRDAAYPCSPGTQPVHGAFACSDLRDSGLARSPPGAPSRRSLSTDAAGYPHSPGASYPQSNSQPSSEDGRESSDLSAQGSCFTALPPGMQCSASSPEFSQEPTQRQHRLPPQGQFLMPSDIAEAPGPTARPSELSFLGRIVTRLPWDEANRELPPESRMAPAPARPAATPSAHQAAPAQAIVECSFWHVRQGEQSFVPPAGSGSPPGHRSAASAALHAASASRQQTHAPEDEELPPWPHEMT